MKKLIILLSVFVISCSSVEYRYQETTILPDSLKDNLREDFMSVIDYDNLSLSGDPDYDDDINTIYGRLKNTYQIKVGALNIVEDGSFTIIPEYKLGNKYKSIYDSLKTEYYGY